MLFAKKNMHTYAPFTHLNTQPYTHTPQHKWHTSGGGGTQTRCQGNKTHHTQGSCVQQRRRLWHRQVRCNMQYAMLCNALHRKQECRGARAGITHFSHTFLVQHSMSKTQRAQHFACVSALLMGGKNETQHSKGASFVPIP